MKPKVQVKVCGITRFSDAVLAAELGADFLGFIFYPKSPRALDFPAFRSLRAKLPALKLVWVQVCPDPDELRAAVAEGFDFFQLHFPAAYDRSAIEQWVDLAGAERLWLAPKIAPGEDFPRHLLPCAGTFLIDTYRKESFGGTGETGDWGRFRKWANDAPEKRWVLAGGLRPENISRALEESGASLVDVSSGLEERPGQKSTERMKAFFAAVGGSPSRGRT